MVLVIGGAYQGKVEYVKEHYKDAPEIIPDLHIRIRDMMKEGIDSELEINKWIEGNSEIILISNEIGCGVVPMDAFEREYRELVGRILCNLANQAKEVVRVICGIGLKIKGEE